MNPAVFEHVGYDPDEVTGFAFGMGVDRMVLVRHGIDDIRSGRARVAMIGSAEAPINPEVMEGYAAMGALATDKGLRQLDGLADSQTPDHRRACRPFAENCGFTIAESAQMLVLFDDALAMELGATVFGAATDVFVNADGFKKSISGPGVGDLVIGIEMDETRRKRALEAGVELEGAADHFQRAYDIWREFFDGDHPRLADALTNLGSIRRRQGRLEESEAFYRRAAEMQEVLHGPDHPLVGAALGRLGSLGPLQGGQRGAHRGAGARVPWHGDRSGSPQPRP